MPAPRRRFGLYAVGGLVAGVAIAFIAASLFLLPVQERETVEIRVDRGESFSSVVEKLKEKRVISNVKMFALWARLRGLDAKIRWGIYVFDLPLAPAEVLDRMVEGKVALRRVTIPEGLTLREIAQLLEQGGLVSRERFLREARDPNLHERLGLSRKGVEGYLFPDTYYFPYTADERDILIAMVRRFGEVFTESMRERARALGLGPDKVVVLASIIEKETAVEAERHLVSAVFHNRLRKRMPLQSDPTVIYGLKRFSGDLTYRDLAARHPYNTYQNSGLPPGPIGNPGLASLKAALEPAPVPYLYFVSKNDGSHLFSSTLREHNEAVRLYQKRSLATRDTRHTRNARRR